MHSQKLLLPPRPGAAPARAIDAPRLAQGGGQASGVACARRREQGAVGQGAECAAGKGVGQSCARVKARTLATPACAWVVSNECTAATVAPQQAWRQRAPHSLLRAGNHCSAAPYRQGTCARTRTWAGVWRRFVALAPMPPSRVAERCVGRLRSPTSLAAHPKRSNCAGRLLQPRGGARNRRQGPLSSGRAAHAPRPVLPNVQCPARTSACGVRSQPAASKSYDRGPLVETSKRLTTSRGKNGTGAGRDRDGDRDRACRRWHPVHSIRRTVPSAL